jgi:predicted TIM-barrel fold metal-dependent hydrolase
MSSGHTNDPAAIRAGLTHPVVDSDGHWLEFGPAIGKYLERVAGRGVVDAFNSRNGRIVRDLELTVDQRRDAGRPQQGWWTFPTRNTLDRATAMVPRLLYERLDELGLDFSVLYPTTGLAVPFISNDEVRRAACRAFNTFAAEQFAPYADRLTPAAVVPMNTPAEAIEELEHVAKTLKLKVVVMASVIKRTIPEAARRSPELARYATWFDMFGLDSAYD